MTCKAMSQGFTGELVLRFCFQSNTMVDAMLFDAIQSNAMKMSRMSSVTNCCFSNKSIDSRDAMHYVKT